MRGLHLAGSYDRVVAADIARVWENVYDWEHLPWLHPASFSEVRLLEQGAWGWRVRAGIPGPVARSVVVELCTERKRSRYVARTLDGPGVGSEIWTDLQSVDPGRTQIRVEFWLPTEDQARARRQGARLRETYARLWDEDEQMMVHRSHELARRTETAHPEEVILGPLDEVRASLPRPFTLGGRAFRLVDVDGNLCAFATRCPHMYGPLSVVVPGDRTVTCPWHGYRFDVCTGASLEGRRLALELAEVEIEKDTGQVRVRRSAAKPPAYS